MEWSPLYICDGRCYCPVEDGIATAGCEPIVSSIGAASYETAKELAKILKPLVGKSMYHVHNTQDFIQQIKGIKLQKDQCMVSFDVKALFTSVPIKPAITPSRSC